MKSLKRREFIKTSILAGSAMILANQLKGAGLISKNPAAYQTVEPGEIPDIVTVSGENPESGLATLLDNLGGISNFCRPGQSVGLLVNSPWKNPGFYTNPDIVLALANLLLQAGAKEIILFKQPEESYWERGNLYNKYKSMIAQFRFGADRVIKEIPSARVLKQAEIFKELDEVDVFISVPVAKHHAGTLFSGNLKGMMGLSTSHTNRHMHSPDGEYTYANHEHLAQCIADLCLIRKPDLCLIDSIECATGNGPAGPGPTVKPGKLIAGVDPLATDVFAAKLIGFAPGDILTFQYASDNGIGEIDTGKVSLIEL